LPGDTVHNRGGHVRLSPTMFACFGGGCSGFTVAANDPPMNATQPLFQFER
jgi:hypothetical protein